jgi:hypothetical protein
MAPGQLALHVRGWLDRTDRLGVLVGGEAARFAGRWTVELERPRPILEQFHLLVEHDCLRRRPGQLGEPVIGGVGPWRLQPLRQGAVGGTERPVPRAAIDPGRRRRGRLDPPPARCLRCLDRNEAVVALVDHLHRQAGNLQADAVASHHIDLDANVAAVLPAHVAPPARSPSGKFAMTICYGNRCGLLGEFPDLPGTCHLVEVCDALSLVRARLCGAAAHRPGWQTAIRRGCPRCRAVRRHRGILPAERSPGRQRPARCRGAEQAPQPLLRSHGRPRRRPWWHRGQLRRRRRHCPVPLPWLGADRPDSAGRPLRPGDAGGGPRVPGRAHRRGGLHAGHADRSGVW